MAKTESLQGVRTGVASAILTQGVVARLLDCSTRSVRQYVADGIIGQEHVAAGGKLYETAIPAVVSHLREQAAGRKVAGIGGDEVDPIAANANLRIAQTAVAKEQLRVVRAKASLLEGAVIRRPAVEAAMRSVISQTKGALVTLPVEINSLLGGLPVSDQLAIEDLIERKLADMARDMPAAIQRTIAAEAGIDDEVEDDA